MCLDAMFRLTSHACCTASWGMEFVEVWGPVEEMTDDKKVAFEKYRKLLTDEALASADASHGRVTFERTCMVCHKMYGKGLSVGPDLTGANRTNLEYILGNVLTPSAVIQDEYKMHVVLTHDGRVLFGNACGRERATIAAPHRERGRTGNYRQVGDRGTCDRTGFYDARWLADQPERRRSSESRGLPTQPQAGSNANIAQRQVAVYENRVRLHFGAISNEA